MAGNGDAGKERKMSFRMAESDYETLSRRCADAGLTRSEYLRYLIRIPLATEENAGAEHRIVVDRKALLRLSRELTKWGYHYNQAVHAMNSINYYVARGTIDGDVIGSRAERIEAELVAVNANAEMLRYELARIDAERLVGA